jgi:hypothetical protein
MYWDKEAAARAFARLDAVHGRVRGYLKQLLDEYHGEARPQRYYDILTGYWLQLVSHAVLVALETPAPPPAQTLSVPVFAVDNEFISRVSEDANIHTLLRSLLAAQPADRVELTSSKVDFGTGAAGDGLMGRLLKRFMARIGSRDAILVCHPYAKCSPLEWLRFVVRARKVMRWDDLDAREDFPPRAPVEVNTEWRLARFRARLGDTADLAGAIECLLPLLVPVAFLEGLARLRTAALRVPIGQPKGFYSAGASYHHLLFKLLTAEHQQATWLLGHQHGGSYGMELRHAPEEFERSICDYFYTWGWDGGTGTRALSPPAFRRFARRKRWSLMLCLADFQQSYYRVQFFPAAEAADTTIRETLAFAEALAGRGAQNLLIRPFSNTYGRQWSQKLVHALPAAHVDRYEKKAIERFRESEVVFHNYISTGWLESIWLDVPTLALYDPAIYAFRPEAAQHVATLERFGLLHRTGAAAAGCYARIQSDVQSWWNQREFREARAHFAARYVRVSNDWQREWIREFESLLKNQQLIASQRP